VLAGEQVNARVIVAALVILGSVALTTRAPSVRRKIKPGAAASTSVPVEVHDK